MNDGTRGDYGSLAHIRHDDGSASNPSACTDLNLSEGARLIANAPSSVVCAVSTRTTRQVTVRSD